MDEPVRVVFASEVLPGFSVDEVKQALGRLFKLEAPRLNAMFAGGRTVIKRSVSLEEGQRYVAKLASVGARVHLEPVAEVDRPTVSASLDSVPWPTILPEPMESAAPAAAQASPFPTSIFAPSAAAPVPPPVAAARSAPPLQLADMAAPSEEQIECPTCGERQPQRVLCRSCATDMARGIAAKREAQEDARRTRLEEARARRGIRPSYAAADSGHAPGLLGWGFTGRLARWPYVAGGLFCWAAMVLLVVSLVRYPNLITGLVLLLGLLVVAVWSVRLAVLRLHDIDLSGWWVLLLFVPYLGAVASLLLMVWPGTHGDNNHGGPARPGNWLLAMVSLGVLCLTLGWTWRTVMLAAQGQLPFFAGLLANQDAAGGDDNGPAPSAAQLADLLPAGEAIEVFRQNYWPEGAHKAFAASPSGAWGWSAGAASIERAVKDAVAACEARRQAYTAPCVPVNINGYGGSGD